MVQKVFSIYDEKAKMYQPPFMAHTKGQVIRTFTDIVNEKGHPINQHPSDYTLFELGTFDNLTGKYECNKTPLSLGVAIEFVNQEVSVNNNGSRLNSEELSKNPMNCHKVTLS